MAAKARHHGVVEPDRVLRDVEVDDGIDIGRGVQRGVEDEAVIAEAARETVIACPSVEQVIACAAVQTCQSPAPPFSTLAPALPVMTLFKALPVPLMLPVPSSVRFSTAPSTRVGV